jgi:hypothetical protein
VEVEKLPLRQWDREDLVFALRQPGLVLTLWRLEGLPLDVGFNQNHPCIDHPDEKTPSGVLDSNGLYWCNHHASRGVADANFTYSQHVAQRHSGLFRERLGPGQTWLWGCRGAYEGGYLPLPDVEHSRLPSLPDDATDDQRKRYTKKCAYYESLVLAARIHALTAPGQGIPFSRKLGAQFSGLTRDHGPIAAEKLAEEFRNELCDEGYLEKVKEFKSRREGALFKLDKPLIWRGQGEEIIWFDTEEDARVWDECQRMAGEEEGSNEPGPNSPTL